MALLRELAPAKVNLTLRIVGKRADGYHDIESLVAFAAVADVVTLDPDAPSDISVSGPFAGAAGPAGENLVLKAAREMKLSRGKFTLEKNIPVAAGLGGGSADAAAALRLIARERSTDTENPRIRAAAAACGADVPVCLIPKAHVMRGIGDRLTPVALPKLAAVLVHPGVALPTRDVFARFTMSDASKNDIREVPRDAGALFGWLAERPNDLTRAAISAVPEIQNVLDALTALPGCKLARMSGSGATCFGLFETQAQAESAGTTLRERQADWWVSATTLG